VSTKRINTLPWPKDPHFVGREDALAGMKERLDEQGCVALSGAGGVGYMPCNYRLNSSMLTMLRRKTQTAIEYCWRFREAHPEFHVFWINAGSIARFDTDYRRLAKRLNLPCHAVGIDNNDMQDGVKDWLNENENWLMVIDNADRYDDFFATEGNDMDDTIQAALPWPRSRTAMVIYTSRHDRVGAQLTDHNCLRLNVMSKSEGVAMFRSKFEDEATDEEVLRLLVALDFLPLSIAHAVAYLKFAELSIDEYLSEFETSDEGLLDILGQNIEAGRRDYRAPRSVVKVCQVSFELLWRHNRAAANQFFLMACLERNNIRQDILTAAGEMQLLEEGDIVSELLINVELPKSQGDMWTAIGEISSLGLIAHGRGQNKFSMHRHVQAIAVSRLSTEGRLLAFSGLSAETISCMLTELGSEVKEQMSYFGELLPTINRVLQLLLGLHRGACDTHSEIHCVTAMGFFTEAVKLSTILRDSKYVEGQVELLEHLKAEFKRKEAEAKRTKAEAERLKAEAERLKAVLERWKVAIREAQPKEAGPTICFES
jgi:hypothetical protein